MRGRRRDPQPWTFRAWLRGGALALLGLLLAAVFFLGACFALAFLVPAGARERPPRDWERVNAQVNTLDRRFAPRAVEGDPDSVFDCEDYAWAKYHALRAAGVAAERMRLFAVTVTGGARHMILVADGWVFDNLEPRLEPEATARGYYKGDWQDRTDPGAVVVIP